MFIFRKILIFILLLISSCIIYADELTANESMLGEKVYQHQLESSPTLVSTSAKTSVLTTITYTEESKSIKMVNGVESKQIVTTHLNHNFAYINKGNYLQNPYRFLPSSILKSAESTSVSKSIIDRIFTEGTWNLMVEGAMQYFDFEDKPSFPEFAYGANLFAQTGSINGFSAGGLLTAVNPFFANNMNGSHVQHSNFLPSTKEVTMSEAFLEFRHQNKVQLDIGYIGINNSPWLSYNFYTNPLAPGANYRGLLLNSYLGAGWLLTGLAFDEAQLVGNTGFSKMTFYNTGADYSSGLISHVLHETSNGTTALGANYTSNDNNYVLRFWGYQFQNYGTLVYADSNIKLATTNKLNFNIATQAGTNNQLSNNSALSNAGYGSIASNFIGLQGQINYDWFNLNLGYNNVWGSSNAYGNGAIVSPYTYGFATDPLYTTPFISGLVDLGTAGQAYRISTPINLVNKQLSIAPSITSFTTTEPDWNGTNEYDLVTTYYVPTVRGLTLFAVYAYQQVPQNNSVGGHSVSEIFASYLF